MPIPYQDQLSAYPPLQLLNLASTLSLSVLFLSSSYVYNLPVFLFGLVAHELHSTTALLQQFLVLLFWSALYDLFSLLGGRSDFFTKILSFIILLLKLPIGLSLSNVLAERGGQFSMAGWAPGRAGGGGQANWTMPSMPGGFGGSGAAQGGNVGPNVQSFNQAPPPPQSNPTAFPSSGGYRLGGEEGSGAPPQAPQPGRNGYSSIA